MSDFPALKTLVDDTLIEFHSVVTITLVNAIKADWELSRSKNVELITTAYAGKTISDAVNAIILDPREKALQAFIGQKFAG